MTTFRSIAMKKGELARLYFPTATAAVATNRLMRWVHQCTPLMKELVLLPNKYPSSSATWASHRPANLRKPTETHKQPR